MNRKYFLLIGIILLMLAVVGGISLWWSLRSKAPSVSPTPIPQVTPTPTSTPIPTEGKKTKSDLEQIREAFAEKYHKSLEETVVNISQNTGTHASGGVRFAGEMGGAMWLAYNDGERWIIVHDGQGTIPCSVVDPYDFPTDMVPECWDEATSTLIRRG